MIVMKLIGKWWVVAADRAGQLDYIAGPFVDRPTAQFSKRRLENRLGIEHLRRLKRNFVTAEAMDEVDRILDDLTATPAKSPVEREARLAHHEQLEAERRKDPKYRKRLLS